MAIRFCACDNERNGKSSPTENMARRPLGPTTVNTVQSSSYATENEDSTNLMILGYRAGESGAPNEQLAPGGWERRL